jgi:pyruvate dehydrogenase E2 component (dihydrolipoamide acetyltransferase)
MNAPVRQFASPYARKLARERGIALAELGGSGPAGRVVAADVLAFVKRVAAIEPLPAPAEPAPNPAAAPAQTVAAIATEIDFGKVHDLVDQFAGAQLALSAGAFLLRAAAHSLAAVYVKGAIGWETGKGEVVITDAGSLSLGRLQDQLDGDPASSGGPAALSIRRLNHSDIRAVSMPLRPGRPLRLVLSGDNGMVDCLLAFDAARIDEDAAVEFLARFKEDLETPLRLLA